MRRRVLERNKKQKGFGYFRIVEDAKVRRDAVLVQINNGDYLN